MEKSLCLRSDTSVRYRIPACASLSCRCRVHSAAAVLSFSRYNRSSWRITGSRVSLGSSPERRLTLQTGQSVVPGAKPSLHWGQTIGSKLSMNFASQPLVESSPIAVCATQRSKRQRRLRPLSRSRVPREASRRRAIGQQLPQSLLQDCRPTTKLSNRRETGQ